MPDRLAFDIGGATTTVGQNRIPVDTSGVLGIRLSQYRADPPTVRIVADLEAPGDFRVFSCDERLVIRLFLRKSSAAHQPQVRTARASELKAQAGTRQLGTAHQAPRANATTPFMVPAAPTAAEVRPPRTDIRYDHGLLTVRVENVTLASAIAGIGRALKANVEMPSGAGEEKIFSEIGPVAPGEALAALLTGSSLNYILVEGAQPDRNMTIVLTPKQPADRREVPDAAGASTMSEPSNEGLLPVEPGDIPEQIEPAQPVIDQPPPVIDEPAQGPRADPPPPGDQPPPVPEPNPEVQDRVPPP